MKQSLSTERAIKLASDPRRKAAHSLVQNQHRMKWSSVDVTGDDIPQIKGHTAVMINKLLILFGGYDGARNSNAVHVLDTTTWSWRTNVKCKGVLPEHRNGHTATAVGHCMYIIGGWLGNGPFASDAMHVLNTDTFEWLVPPTTGTPPGPCNMHSTDYMRELGIILVFRGGDGAQYLNDLHCLNLRTSSWSCMETTGQAPTPRANHGSSTVGRRLFIFGGWDGQQPLNDMHCFEVGPNTWTKVACRGIPPAPRTGKTMLNIRDKLYVFGGAGVDSTFDDLQIFDPKTSTWFMMGTASPPKPKGAASGVGHGRQRGHSATPSERPPWHSHDRARAASAGAVNGMMEVESNGASDMFSDDNPRAKSWPKDDVDKGKHAGARTTSRMVVVEGEGPGRRSGHSTTAMGRGRYLLVFGGSRELTYPTELIKLDTDPPPTMHVTPAPAYQMIQSRMKHFFESKEMSDVIFTDGKHSMPAHRILLALQSERFRAMFSLGFRETTEKVLPIPAEVKFRTFRLMLQFLYTGTLPSAIQSWGGVLMKTAGRDASKRTRRAFLERNVEAIRGALDLLRSADQFMIRPLKERCEVALGELLKFRIVSADELMKAAASANADQLVALCRHHIRNRKR